MVGPRLVEQEKEKRMLIAEARVDTERPSRYLAQLCRHVQEVGQAHPHMHARVEWSDTHGVISFSWGRCTLRAEPGTLALCAEAGDEETLRWVQQRIADRLERFGRRDRLTVSWSGPQARDEQEENVHG